MDKDGIVAARAVAAGRGLAWIREGFALFLGAPGRWILITLVFLLIMTLLGLIPVVSILGSLLSPVLIGGLMLGCRSLEREGLLHLSHLFAGFQERTLDLIKAGLLYLGLVLAVSLLMFLLIAILGLAGTVGGAQAATPQLSLGLLLVVLLGSLAMLPVVMGFIFAPPLLVFNPELGVVNAYKSSFYACMKNIWPFTLFSLLVLLLFSLAIVSLGLGLFVLVPILVGATYRAYTEMFEEGVVA